MLFRSVVRKELNTSGGVVKHPKNIKKVVRKKLNTSGGVVEHPVSRDDCVEELCYKKNI